MTAEKLSGFVEAPAGREAGAEAGCDAGADAGAGREAGAEAVTGCDAAGAPATARPVGLQASAAKQRTTPNRPIRMALGRAQPKVMNAMQLPALGRRSAGGEVTESRPLICPRLCRIYHHQYRSCA